MKFNTSNYLKSHEKLFNLIDKEAIDSAINLINKKYEDGKKIITCGNGGSAHTASHFITDWNKMIFLATGKQFKGISLCDNIGIITAYSNDLNYNEIFSGQLTSILESGDLVIAVSGSGNSQNVIKAVEFANKHGSDTLAIVGYDGGELKKIAKYNFWVPCFDMQLCEDIHLMFGHMVMKSLCKIDIKE